MNNTSTINTSLLDAVGRLAADPKDTPSGQQIKTKVEDTKRNEENKEFFQRWAPVVCDYPFPMGVPFEV